jgi:hypothetical protein
MNFYPYVSYMLSLLSADCSRIPILWSLLVREFITCFILASCLARQAWMDVVDGRRMDPGFSNCAD